VSRLGQAERGFRFGSPPPSRDEGQGRQGEVQQRRRRGFAAAGFRGGGVPVPMDDDDEEQASVYGYTRTL